MAERSINTFSKGLASDYSGDLQPNSFYVDSMEGRLIFNEDGSLAWQQMNGTINEVDINFDYGNYDDYLIVGYAELKNGALLFSYSMITLYSEIGKLERDNSGNYSYYTIFNDKYDPNGELLLLGSTPNTGDDRGFIYGNEMFENSKTHRVYWQDGVNEPKVINIELGKEPEFTNGDYQPLNSGFYPYFYSVNSLKLNPDLIFGRLIYARDVDGQIESGYYKYTYRYSTRDGYRSNWFPAGPTIFATDVDKKSSNSEEYYMGESGKTTNTGHKIFVNDFDKRFDKIEFAYVYYKTKDQPDHANIFSVINIDPSMAPNAYVEHKNNSGKPLNIDEIPLTFRAFKKARADNIKDQRYLIGNYETYDIGQISVDGDKLEPQTRAIELDSLATNQASYPLRHVNPKDSILEIPQFWNYSSQGLSMFSYPVQNDYMNYKGKQVSNVARSMFRGETYRIGVLVFDLKGNPWFVKHAADITMPKQHEKSYSLKYYDSNNNIVNKTVNISNVYEGYFSVTNHDPDGNRSHPHQFINTQTQDFSLNLVILGIKIGGIDITDVADKISGVQVVRAERNNGLQFQGILSNMVKTENDSSPRMNPTILNYYFNDFLAMPVDSSGVYNNSNSNYAQSAKDVNYKKKNFNFTFDSPDLVIETSKWGNYNLGSSSNFQIQNAYYSEGSVTGRSSSVFADSPLVFSYGNGFHHYGKFYYFDTEPSYRDDGKSGKNFSLDGLDPLSQQNDIQNFNNNNETAKHGNDWYTADDNTHHASANWLTFAGNGTLDSAECWNGYSNMCFFIANLYDGESDYGGLSEDSLQNTVYVPTGHFQPINDYVLSSINDGSGNYVIDDAQVFGGDCYVGLYDRTRNLAEYKKSYYFDSGYIFPMESKYNLELVAGRSYASVGTHSSGGVVHVDDPDEFNYNSSLLTREQHFLYNGYPITFDNITEFPNTWVYSDQKLYGESEDSFRKFRTNSFEDIDGGNGEITGSAILFDEIYSIQEYGLGRLRMNDRAVVPSQDSGNLNIGSGGVLDGVDYITHHYGTSYRGSIIETPRSFYFVDNIKNKIIRFAQNGVDPISDSKNIHSMTENLMGQYVDKGKTSVISSSYDYKNGDVLFSLFDSKENSEALIFNEYVGQFVTRSQVAPNIAFNMFDDMVVLTSSDSDLDTRNKIYTYGNGIRGVAFEDFVNSYLSFYVNDNMQYSKVFDNIYFNTENNNISVIDGVEFYTKSANHFLSLPDDRIIFREGLIKMPIHEFYSGGSSKTRARGQKMLVKIKFFNFNNELVRVNNAETIFRHSRKL